MPTIKWNPLTDPSFEIRAQQVTTPWLPVVLALRDYTHLQIRVEGSWTQGGGAIGLCGPDGLSGLPLQVDRLLVADCQLGALIGKLGGSSASLSVPPSGNPEGAAPPKGTLAEGKAFAIGSYCVVSVPSTFVGPLFVSFNGLMRPVQVDRLKISVEGATAG